MVKFFDFWEVQRAFAGSYDHQCAFDGRGDTEADETATAKKKILPRKLTWNVKVEVWKMTSFCKGYFFFRSMLVWGEYLSIS